MTGGTDQVLFMRDDACICIGIDMHEWALIRLVAEN